MTEALNTLILCADQLSPFAPGYARHGWARTPNLDRLAERGLVFEDASCTSPICVPARASLATGRYVHELGTWDNAHAYSGREAPSWGRLLTDAGRQVTTIGKLHFRDNSATTGFPHQIIPMHAEGGVGDTFSLLRDDLQPRPELHDMVAGARTGDSSYTRYDDAVTTETLNWLEEHRHDPEPWTTFVSHVSPHHPLVAPPEFVQLYSLDDIPEPHDWRVEDQPHHPALDRFRAYYGLADPFTELEVRRARATYFGLVSYLDHQIGLVLRCLEETGLADRTRVVFTSDHGDNVGDHGLWWKNTMYAGSVGVPLVLAGPDVDPGRVPTPVSHVDLVPTILELAGVRVPGNLPGTDLREIASRADQPDRLVFAEYHAAGSASAVFMVADSRYRYVEYVNDAPQLFDRQADPDERTDLGESPAHAQTASEYARRLREICLPEEVDRRAKADQAAAIHNAGGREAVRAAGFRTHVPPPEISG